MQSKRTNRSVSIVRWCKLAQAHCPTVRLRQCLIADSCNAKLHWSHYTKKSTNNHRFERHKFDKSWSSKWYPVSSKKLQSLSNMIHKTPYIPPHLTSSAGPADRRYHKWKFNALITLNLNHNWTYFWNYSPVCQLGCLAHTHNQQPCGHRVQCASMADLQDWRPLVIICMSKCMTYPPITSCQRCDGVFTERLSGRSTWHKYKKAT